MVYPIAYISLSDSITFLFHNDIIIISYLAYNLDGLG